MRMMFAAAAGAALVSVVAWSPPVQAESKTLKQCRAEWSANKDSMKAAGKTQRVFVAECRGAPILARAKSLTVGSQYPSEAEAKAGCPDDSIVWVNMRSKIYHEPGSRNYGATREGGYMCEKKSVAAGCPSRKTGAQPRERRNQGGGQAGVRLTVHRVSSRLALAGGAGNNRRVGG